MTDGIWQDLKRRRVFRVGAAYVAIAFATLEGADLVLPRLGLPDRALTVLVVLAVIGFPIALGLSWAYRLSGRGRSASIQAEAPALAPVSTQRLQWGLLVLATVLFAAGAWWWIPRVPSLRPVDVDPASILVLPFDVRGGEDVAYLREGLVDLLSTKLDGVGGLRVVDPGATLARVRSEGEVRTPEDGLALAASIGAGRAILGGFVAAGDEVQLRATVHGAAGEEAAAVVEGRMSDLLGLVDRLVSDLIAHGLIREEASIADLEGLTTASNEALRNYLTGVQNFRRGQAISETFALLERAVALDTAFALASYWAGYIADFFDIGDPVEHYRRAMRHQDRLGPRDRMRLTAAMAGGEGRHQDAIRAYAALVERYPDDLAGWFQLGEQIAHTGQYSGRTLAEARLAYERAVEIDPSLAPVYYHLAQIGGLQGDSAALFAWAALLDSPSIDDLWPSLLRLTGGLLTGDSADVARGFARLRAAESEQAPATIGWSTGELLASVLDHDAAAARRLAREFVDRAVTDTARTVASRWIARIDAALGRFADAEVALRNVERTLGSVLAQDLAWLALHPLGAPPERIEAVREGLVGKRPAPGSGEEAARHYLLARLALEEGRRPAADAAMDALDAWTSDDAQLQRFAEDLSLEVRAIAAARDGDPRLGLDLLLEASYWERSAGWQGFPVPSYLDERLADRAPAYLRAELLAAVDRDAEAATWYEVAADGTWYRAMARVGLARLHARNGRTDEARDLYRLALDMLGDADADLNDAVRSIEAESEVGTR